MTRRDIAGWLQAGDGPVEIGVVGPELLRRVVERFQTSITDQPVGGTQPDTSAFLDPVRRVQ